ncbi:hypothetical protein ABPG74_018588 [Tetrahymena malaccensis]
MIFKSDSLLSFFVFLVIQSYVKSLTTSVDVDGCIVYTSDKYNICTQCLEGYELDSKNNICIYTKCSNNLFYDKNQKDVNSKESGCVAVCSTFSYKNQQSNICQKMISIDNVYVLAFNINSEKKSVFQIFYDLSNQELCLSNSFTVDDFIQFFKIIDQWLFTQNQNTLERNSNYFNILSSSQLGVYVLVQDQSAYLVNLIINSYKSIEIQYIEGELIQRSKIFEAQDTDLNVFLIALTSQYLIYTNLQTNQSNYIKLNYLYYMKDLEIFNLWGNEKLIIAIDQQNRLEIIQFDSSSQQFFLKDQISNLYYIGTDLLLVRYQNQSSTQKQLIDELVIKGSDNIQIIQNQGSLLEEQNQLIKMNVITNFNLQFPTSLQDTNLKLKNIFSKYKSNYYSPLILMSNSKNNQTYWYDCTEKSACKLYKQLRLNKNYERLFLFSRYIIFSDINYSYLMDIFTSQTFPSLQDQINDKYFINQIAILDESSNFLIYNFTLSQIYKLNSKIISGIKQINIVVNDRNTYVLQGKEGVLFINIQDNTQNLIKTTLFFDQIEKKVNELGKMYYQAFNFLDSSIEEYIIDIDTKIVRLLSTYQVNSLDFLPYYVQNFKNTNITLTRLDSKNNQNTFYPSYVQISNNRKFTSDKNLKNAILNIQSSKLFVLLTQQVTYIDIYSGFQETIFSFANPLDSQVIKQYADFIILQSQNEIILINTYSNEKYVKNYPQQLINNVEYSKNDKLIYIYGNFLQILDTQLKVVQDISNVNQDQSDFICNDFQFQFVCLNTFFSDFKELFVYDKIQNTTKTVKIDNAYLTYSVFDEIYQNIFIYENQNNQLNQIRIYSSNGVLKQTIQISVSDCMLFKIKLICKLQRGLILIDRDSLAFNKLLILEDDSIQIRKFIYIEYLNFLLLQLDNNLSQISIYDVSAEQFVYKIQVNLNQLKNNNITYFQYDESQSSYVMLFDSEGKFYLSSIDSDKPFQNFINICNGCDQTLFEFISHDCLQNQIYLRINESVYQFDYELLGIERDPVLNEPFSLFTSIYISETLTDYLILSQNNVVFRYSQNQLKTELSIIKSDIQSIKYNQKSDVLVLALADSILLYKQYQFNIKNQIDHDIQLLDIIQFQQFITDSEIETIHGVSLINYNNQLTYLYLQIPAVNIQNALLQISQLNNSESIIAPYNTQNNFIILSNNTFQNLNQSILQFTNFSLTFQNDTNLFININQNKKTQEIIFQNMAISFACFGTNQIYISDVEKVVFLNIKIYWLNLKECSNQNQLNSLFFFYNVSEIFIYNLEISNNNFYQKSQVSVFQFQLIKNVLINWVTMTQNINLSSLMSFQQIQNVTLENVTVKDNIQAIQITQLSGIFSFYGCNSILFINCIFGFNTQLVLVSSTNQYTFQNKKKELQDDNLVFINFKAQKNKCLQQQIMFIQTSYVQFNNFTYIENQGSFFLSRSKEIEIQQEGCSVCINSNNQNTCTKCQESYELDLKNNICVYTKCSSNLFYDKNYLDDSSLGNLCLAICGEYSYKNELNNLCQNKQKCSIQRSTSQYMDDNTTTINFYIYQNNYYVLQKEDQLSVYNRFNLNLIKNIKLEARDLQVFNVNNAIFIIGSDNSITLLDIISESRIQKKFTNMISVNSFTQIDQINNQYILVINFQIEKEFECQIFYDSVNQIFTLSNSIIINVIPEKIKFVDQWLVIQSQNNIIVYEIIISKNNLNLNLQINNHFIFSAQQNSDYFDILFTNQLGIYILVQDKSACFVNLNNNSFKPILIDLSDKQYILKSRMFQPSFSDLDQYLIISSNESLVFTNLQTNISNSIKIFNMPYFDFEISNLWGNEKQIVVLWENVNLSFYQLDQKLQIFIELNQKFVLNYQTNNRLYQLNYQSKSQAQKEYIYELVTIDDSSIQIINRESNPSQQQTQLIQINVITNFNLPFPTVALVQSSNFDFSGLPSFIVISYIPPLVISLNDSQEINFYDYSEIENLKFQQQLKISSNLLTIQKFSSNKIIALEPTMGYIIDINTKNVVNIFYTDRCQYATNSNYLAIIYENCLIIKSEEMNTLFNNCQTGFQDFNFNIYLNDDLKIITQEKSGQYISVFQLDLQNQSIQFLNKITNIKLFQIIKSFSTFQDEINNSFSIEQIVIIDQNNSFKIYNFSLSLIYQMNQLNVTQIKSINQVVNELQIYVVQGYEGILLLNVTSNTQILIKSNFKFNGQSQIKKKLNQDGQIQYQKYEFYSTTIVEYIIDIQQNQVVELGNYQVNQTSFLSAYIQNVKNTNINQINYFGNDNTELMFTSYVQNPYAEILIDKISKTVSLDLKNGKLYLYSQISNSIIQFDIYTRFSQTLYTFKQNLNLPEFKYYEDFLLIFDGKNIFLINIFTADNYVKNNLKINNAEYSKDEKVIYVYTTSSVSILDTKLNIIQELFNYTDDLTCINFKCQIVCYCTFPIDTQAYFLIIDKVQKIPHYIYSEQEVLEFLFDQEYENIFVFPTEINLLKIYSSDGNLKQIFEKIVSVCRIFTLNILCESDQSLLLIDRITLTIKSKIKNISYSLFKNIYLIENLNYLIFQNKYILSQISVYDITAQAEINQIKIERQTEFKEIIKQQLQVDTISTSYVMFLDQSGTFYLCSLNPSFHFYSYIKIYEPYSTLQPSQFIYDGLSNNIYFSYQANVYILDYYLSGQQNEPQLNEPYNLFSQINVNSQQVDYLILSQGNLIFRYSQQKLQFELSIIQSRILDIKYNEKSDVLILGLVDSILFYQQYQLCKNGNLDLNIQQLEAIQFQQFITDSIVITYNHQILHLNILKGAIIKEIQFNVTQIVTSFNVNKNQDLIIIGFSDGQLLQYNLASQIYFLYNTTQIGPLNISIFFIQITETSNVEQIAYAISNSGLLFQIDILNKKVISQTDLRVLVKEDPATTLSQFLIDQTYQRYIFSFSGQKKAYVWNYSNNQQEAYLSLPKKESKLRIEQNFLFIQCIFQINLYTFNTKIEFVSFVKKNVLNDTIIDFKLFVNNVVAILLIDRFELYIIDGDIFTMIAQISYQYPRILSYSFDTDQNMLYILGMHKAGVFQNIYNLNIHKLDSISECSFFSSIQEQQNILEELASVTIKKNQIQTINGVYLINQDNYQIYNYIEVPAINIQNTFLQVSQFKSSQFVIAPYDEQNKFLALTNDTFYNFRQSNLQLNNFSLTFQNDTNLFVNITQNKQIQQVVFQNMVIEFACFGTNQIYLSDIEKTKHQEYFHFMVVTEQLQIHAYFNLIKIQSQFLLQISIPL